MRFLLRFASLVMLSGAVIVGTVDAIRSVAASALVVAPLEEAWRGLDAASLDGLQSTVSYYLHPKVYSFVFQSLLAQPAFAVLLALSLLLWMAGYRKPQMAGRFAV